MSETKDRPKSITELLELHPDAPTTEDIAAWKQQHEVFGSAFTEKEVFLFRPITRAEHDGVQREALVAQQTEVKFDLDRAVVDICLLWASGPGKSAFDKKAGTVSTLQEQIGMRSNFFSPAVAYQMVEEL